MRLMALSGSGRQTLFNVCDNARALISENRDSVNWCVRIACGADFLRKRDKSWDNNVDRFTH